MTRVTLEDLAVAIEWLHVNEGDEGEAESCVKVAAWLREEITNREREIIVRKAAKELGRPATIVRQLMKARNMVKNKDESRYKIKKTLDGYFDVYAGDVKLSGYLSRANAEAAINRYEAADKLKTNY